jgi:hypothetical protein
MPPPVEAPYEIVPAGPQLRSVAWPQLGFLAFVVVAALLPLGLALALAA